VVLTAIEAVKRRLELSAIWFPASRAFGDLVPGELGGRRGFGLGLSAWRIWGCRGFGWFPATGLSWIWIVGNFWVTWGCRREGFRAAW
jgi:hypothetical protein